jgi:Na+-driven multidrug efflux pump
MMMFPIVGYQMVITNFFQSIGKAKISIFLSLSRQLLFLLPMLIILPPIFGVDGVWASMPISDAISSVVTGGVMIAYMKKFNRQHKELTNGK